METYGTNKEGGSPNGYRYAFDDFEVDPANRLLLRSGQPIPLTAKVFDILLILAENPDRLLSKDELIEAIWPDEFVEQGNLARNISTLRKALGDTGKQHKYIATIQGRGYRFVAKVEKIDRLDGVGSGADGTGRSLSAVLLGRFWLVSFAAIIMLVFGVIFLQSGFSPTKPQDPLAVEKVRATKLTQDGNVYGAAISPDGQFLVYTALGARDERTLCVRQIATGSVLTVLPPRTGVAYWGAAVARDNSFIYYNVNEDDKTYGTIYRVPLFGKQAPRKIVDIVGGGPIISPDGSRIGFTRMDKQAGTESFITVNNDGTDEKTVMSIPLDSKYNHIDYSPGGQTFTYVVKRHEPDQEAWYIAEIPIDGGTETLIEGPTDTKIIAAKWLPDRSGLIVNALDPETKRPQLYFHPYPEGPKRKITSDVNGHYGFGMTADGRTIVTNPTISHHSLWVSSDKDRAPAVQVTTGTERHFDSIAWMGNEYLLFDEDRSGDSYNHNIWRIRHDGTDELQLTFGTGNNKHPTISPDGQTIVFVSKRSGKTELWRMNADGNDVRQLTDLPHNVYYPQFSQDGRSVYFGAFVQGKGRVWQVSIDGGDAAPVLDSEVYQWSVSPDGRLLAYSVFDQEANRIRTRIHPLDSSEADRVLDVAPETWLRWTNDGRSIDYNTISDDIRNVWRIDLDGSPARKVTEFKDEQIYRCALSADGLKRACIRHIATYDAIMIRFD